MLARRLEILCTANRNVAVCSFHWITDRAKAISYNLGAAQFAHGTVLREQKLATSSDSICCIVHVGRGEPRECVLIAEKWGAGRDSLGNRAKNRGISSDDRSEAGLT